MVGLEMLEERATVIASNALIQSVTAMWRPRVSAQTTEPKSLLTSLRLNSEVASNKRNAS